MSVEASYRPRRRPEVEAVAVDGELVLWDPSGRSVHRLDAVGSLLWPFLDGSVTVAELASDVSEVWGISPELAEGALAGLMEQLGSARLLDDVDAPSERRAAHPQYLVDPPSP